MLIPISSVSMSLFKLYTAPSIADQAHRYDRLKDGLTPMIPPPVPEEDKNPSPRPNILAHQSNTTCSNSVQAGEQIQLNPGFDTAEAKSSPIIDSNVEFDGK